jgi:helix-turn-helix protein
MVLKSIHPNMRAKTSVKGCRMISNVNNRQTRRGRKDRRSPDDPDKPMLAAAEGKPILADYLTTEQLAAELNVAPLTLIRWRLQKIGPPITHLGRRILYRRSSVQAWLAARETEWRQ